MLKRLAISLAREVVHRGRDLRIARLGGQVAFRNVGNRLVMEIDPHDFMDRCFYLGTYDPRIMLTIQHFVQEGETCLDVGAHKGYVALHMARAVGESGMVVAFEPDARAARVLSAHCERNHLSNVSVSCCALGDADGTCHLMLSSQLGWSSRFLNEEASPTAIGSVEVPLRALDSLVEGGEIRLDLSRLSLIKVDVEGSEPLVLRGMRRVLAASSPLLWIEINHGSLHAAGFSASDVERELTDLGFSIYVPRFQRHLLGSRVLFEPLADIESQVVGNTDIAALKKDSPFAARLRSFRMRIVDGPREGGHEPSRGKG